MANKIPFITLNNGRLLPQLGLGTWRAKGNESYKAVFEALRLGYRHIDTAFFYGNEEDVGRAISDGMAKFNIARKDICVVTKLPNTCNRPSLVVPALKSSLAKLKLDFVDLYLVHTPVCLTPVVDGVVSNEGKRDEMGKPVFDDLKPSETWKGMEDCVKSGLALSIGVSNFNSEQVDDVLKHCTIKPVTNQVECHPLLVQNKLRDFCLKRDIVLTTFRALGGQVKKPGDPNVLANPLVKKLAAKYAKTPAQILLRWHVEKGHIVLVKSSNTERLKENMQIFDFKLSDEDVHQLEELATGHRYCPYLDSKPSKQYPFHIEY